MEEDFSAEEGVEGGRRSAVNMWKRREEVVLYLLVTCHVAQRDWLTALQWLEHLVTRHQPPSVNVLAKYGQVQLQMGDLKGAQSTFAAAEVVAGAGLGRMDKRTQSLIQRNRGLVMFALKQYPSALEEFNAVLARDPSDAIAANNKALCLMYARDLMGAISVLEDVLQNNPLTALNETLVLNLCSMYELGSSNCTKTKRTLSNWLMRLAPDDFDLMCTRL